MNFDPNNYLPPLLSLDGGWNDAATNTMGRLVTQHGNYYGSGEELFEAHGRQIAEMWIDKDEDPDPAYDWLDVMEKLCDRFWSNDATTNPDLGTGKMVEEDVIVVSRYQKGGSDAPTGPLDEALKNVFDFDAHFVPVVGPKCRPTKKMEMLFSYLVFDVDCPDHAPLADSMQWLKMDLERLEGHEILSQYRAFYTTKNGYRVIYQPSRYLTKKEMPEMRLVYNQRFRDAGIEVDVACKDFSRIFRLPHVTRDGVYVEPLVLDITENTVEVEALPKKVKNFTWDESEDGKAKRVAVGVTEVVTQILTSTGGWPKSVSGALFYMEGDITRYLNNATQFMAWLGWNIDELNIHEGSGFVSKGEIFAAIPYGTENYDSIHKYPYEPRYKDVYLLEEVEAGPVGTPRLDKLLEFFHPDSHLDKVMMKAAFMTPMFNGASRPVFTIDSSSGRGSGKTSLVKSIGDLYDGLIDMPVSEVKKKITEEVKRLFFYEGARTKRVVLIDNVTGFFGNAGLASFITADNIYARRPYASSVESRNNDVTIFVTSNDAHYDKDFITRTAFIFLKSHTPTVNWGASVSIYIDKYREEILGEIIGTLQRDGNVTLPGGTRFAEWEDTVLKKCCKDEEEYSQLMKELNSTKDEFDSDKEACDEIMTLIEGNIPVKDGHYFLPKKDLYDLYRDNKGELSYNIFRSLVTDGIKSGNMGQLSMPKRLDGRYKSNTKRGWIWGIGGIIGPIFLQYSQGKLKSL
jgi:hypothetical protein